MDTAQLLGNLGEFVGAIAVVLTLIYLAIQIKQNTHAISASNQIIVQRNIKDIGLPLIRDRELGAIVLKALVAPDNLRPEEKMAAYAFFFDMLKAGELAYSRYLAGELEAEYWEATLNFYRSYWSTPGIATYWRDRWSAFTVTFQAGVDRWIDETPSSVVRADRLFAGD